jgi:hypothetical protein
MISFNLNYLCNGSMSSHIGRRGFNMGIWGGGGHKHLAHIANEVVQPP